ncbi:hypothetical protein RO1_05590 [Roseburia intestinalis XB6B4]|jgi:hypothetical protein|uniref:Uncharacterized protein n=1 Tax=Roseburia intestinalis XB6B4 TaxID=718255 RepID=D4KVB8_9FIRM|nr:hypothetical protein RO1_05590 [Roseburia intestinalis XB6B4]
MMITTIEEQVMDACSFFAFFSLTVMSGKNI